METEEGDLPLLWETKRTLDGREKRFACHVLEASPGRRVVLFVAPAAMHVHGVDLPAGTVTFGHFWEARPYNVYHWLDRDGQTLGYYFNLCDEVVMEEGALSWRDLVVDILVRPGKEPEILDEHELAELGASAEERVAAADARQRLFADLPALLPELERLRARHWPRYLAWQSSVDGGARQA